MLFRFVSSVLPPGGEELKGDEVDRIVSFKNSLGIDDPDAAAMHMEVFFVFVVYIYTPDYQSRSSVYVYYEE